MLRHSGICAQWRWEQVSRFHQTRRSRLAGGSVVMAPEIVFAILETIQMALIGTSRPCSRAAVRAAGRAQYVAASLGLQRTRLVLNAKRADPDIILR